MFHNSEIYEPIDFNIETQGFVPPYPVELHCGLIEWAEGKRASEHSGVYSQVLSWDSRYCAWQGR